MLSFVWLVRLLNEVGKPREKEVFGEREFVMR